MVVSALDHVLEDITRAYASLERPNFSFVRAAMTQRPYEDLERRIRQSFEVEEITDPNDDVSFNYVVGRDGQRWQVGLSMVGPYAAVLRPRDDGVDLVSDQNIPTSPAEAELTAILRHDGLRLLDRATLEEPIGLRLFSADPPDVRLYQALFTDTAVLPWEGWHARR